MLFNKIAIIGVGLIGGSLARALRANNQCRTISGYGRSRENLDKAIALGVIDDYSDDMGAVVKDADLVLLATPLASFAPLLEKIKPYVNDKLIITDAGSEKGSVVEAARKIIGDKIKQFVPGHPIAGTEKSGVEASFKELYEDHLVILTPLPENKPEQVKSVSTMWESCGARVVNLDVEYHDKVLAATSHLPHVLAYALVDCLSSMEEEGDVFKFSAGGFRDLTRIAASNPEMWSDICLANKYHLLQLIDRYSSHLDKIKELIVTDDGKGLSQLFSKVRNTRENLK
jgi:prephenate dehydrogenase